MSNVTLPQFPDIAPTDDWDSVIECVNSYAEEYAAERVREALEQAASICDRFADRGMHPAECAGAIRALIPKQ